jgi:3-oxoacyl-(acyl-carrier-protein) synthase
MMSSAVRTALGEGECARIPVTTWEASVGHALAATGVLGLVHAAWMLETGRAHPTFGCEHLDPECRLEYVLAEPRPLRAPCVLTLTVGFGGQNGATIVASPEMAADLAGAVGKAVA